MSEPLTAEQMVHDRLEADGYDGLFNEGEDCACELGGISPESCLVEGCTAGYKTDCCPDPDDCEIEGKHFHIVPHKAWTKATPPEGDDDANATG